MIFLSIHIIAVVLVPVVVVRAVGPAAVPAQLAVRLVVLLVPVAPSQPADRLRLLPNRD